MTTGAFGTDPLQTLLIRAKIGHYIAYSRKKKTTPPKNAQKNLNNIAFLRRKTRIKNHHKMLYKSASPWTFLFDQLGCAFKAHKAQQGKLQNPRKLKNSPQNSLKFSSLDLPKARPELLLAKFYRWQDFSHFQ